MKSSKRRPSTFQFKQFTLQQDRCAMKFGTDGMLLGAWAEVCDSQKTGLDIGTGTGVLALMLAQRHSTLRLKAVELDKDAAAQATENVQNSPWQERIEVFQQTIQDFSANSEEQFDLIVSNPPYFQNSLLAPDQRRTQARHTVTLPHNELLDCVQKHLSESGVFCVVLPIEEGLQMMEAAQARGLFLVRKTEVQTVPNKTPRRLLLQWSRQPGTLLETRLTIEHGEPRRFTEDYIALTKEFHLHL